MTADLVSPVIIEDGIAAGPLQLGVNGRRGGAGHAERRRRSRRRVRDRVVQGVAEGAEQRLEVLDRAGGVGGRAWPGDGCGVVPARAVQEEIALGAVVAERLADALGRSAAEAERGARGVVNG